MADELDDLDDASISIPDKFEGFAVSAGGHDFPVTDNNGNGETVLLDVERPQDGDGAGAAGEVHRAFAGAQSSRAVGTICPSPR